MSLVVDKLKGHSMSGATKFDIHFSKKKRIHGHGIGHGSVENEAGLACQTSLTSFSLFRARLVAISGCEDGQSRRRGNTRTFVRT